MIPVTAGIGLKCFLLIANVTLATTNRIIWPGPEEQRQKLSSKGCVDLVIVYLHQCLLSSPKQETFISLTPENLGFPDDL